MKKLCTLLMVAFLAINTFAAVTPVKPTLNAHQVLLPVGNTGQTISLYSLAHISLSDFERVTGNEMKFSDRVGFKLAQHHLRKSIADDGTIQNKKVKKVAAKVTAGETGFHAGGFFLGFFLGLIGVLITLLFKDDYKRNRTKWALLGWSIWLVAILALRIAILAGA